MSSAKDEYEELLFLHEEIKRLNAINRRLVSDLILARRDVEAHKSGHMTMVRVTQLQEKQWQQLLIYMYHRECDLPLPSVREWEPTEDFANWIWDLRTGAPHDEWTDFVIHDLGTCLSETHSGLMQEIKEREGGAA